MCQSFLKFNDNKPEVTLFGPPNSASSVGANLGDLWNNSTQAAAGFNIWCQPLFWYLRFKNVVNLCSYQSKIVPKITSFLSVAFCEFYTLLLTCSLTTIVHSFWVSAMLPSTVQSVENAAARLISGTKWYEHITPALPSQHQLLVSLCIYS